MTEIDGNKTALTHRVTATAAAYLDGLGCKPIESEVTVAPSWIADLASYVYFTMTEWKKAKLHKRFIDPGERPYAGYERFTAKHGFPLTVMVEVKTTTADFRKDLKRKFSSPWLPAHLCYVAAPVDLKEEVSKLPNVWGHILTTKDGKRIYRTSAPLVVPQNPGDTINLIAEVGIRRAHRTRYAELRALMRSHNAKESQRKKTMRINDMMRAVCGWLTGKGAWEQYESLEDAFKFNCLKMSSLSKDSIAELKRIKEMIE